MQNFNLVFFPRWLCVAIISLIILGLPTAVSHAQCVSGGGEPVSITCATDDADGITSAEVTASGDFVTINAGVTVGQSGVTNGTIVVRGLAGGDLITNDGTLFGTLNGGDNDDILTNNGSITGDLDAGGANPSFDLLINTGMVTGTIYGNDGDQLVSNAGTAGAIALGAGNDTLTHSGLASNLDLNDGDDLLIILQGAMVVNTIIGGGGTDQVQFQFTLTEADALAFNTAFDNYFATLDPDCGTGQNLCDNTLTFTLSEGTYNYTFDSVDQLVKFVRVMAPDEAPALNPATQMLTTDQIRVVLLPSLDIEVYGGFSESLPNGFLVGQIPTVTRAGTECVLALDANEFNPGWSARACPLGNNRLLVQVFDGANNFIAEFNNPTFTLNAEQSETPPATRLNLTRNGSPLWFFR